MSKRQPGQSQLDYLWVNYGDFSVSNTISEDENVILTQKAITSILKELGGVQSVKIIGDILEVKSSTGIVNTYPLPSGISIQNFTRRQIEQSDRNKGCELPLGTWVYSIMLSNGNEYLAPTNVYIGKESSSILVNLLENTIYAELKISNRPSIISINTNNDGISADLNISSDGGILFNKTDDGLQGNVILQNSDKFVKFSLLTETEYSELRDTSLIDDTTMYFIKGQQYFYFGSYKMCGSSGTIELDNYYTKTELDNMLKEYATKTYVATEVDKNTINWTNF